MAKAKYIIVERNEMDIPIVFSPFLQHADVARGLRNLVSAGFCSKTSNGWECWGGSVSLQINSRPVDAMILNKTLEYDI